MKDPTVDRSLPWYRLLGTGLSYWGDGRCCICAQFPRTLHTHEVTTHHEFQYLNTCNSQYCRAQDVVRWNRGWV